MGVLPFGTKGTGGVRLSAGVVVVSRDGTCRVGVAKLWPGSLLLQDSPGWFLPEFF